MLAGREGPATGNATRAVEMEVKATFPTGYTIASGDDVHFNVQIGGKDSAIDVSVEKDFQYAYAYNCSSIYCYEPYYNVDYWCSPALD